MTCNKSLSGLPYLTLCIHSLLRSTHALYARKLSVTVAHTSSDYLQNPTEWNWRGKIGFFWGPICLLCFAWAYFRLPEMKVSLHIRSGWDRAESGPQGRSYYELDILFERKVSARKFKTTFVEHDADENYRREAGIVTQ